VAMLLRRCVMMDNSIEGNEAHKEEGRRSSRLKIKNSKLADYVWE